MHRVALIVHGIRSNGKLLHNVLLDSFVHNRSVIIVLPTGVTTTEPKSINGGKMFMCKILDLVGGMHVHLQGQLVSVVELVGVREVFPLAEEYIKNVKKGPSGPFLFVLFIVQDTVPYFNLLKRKTLLHRRKRLLTRCHFVR